MISLYFHIHQPVHLKPYTTDNIELVEDYMDEQATKSALNDLVDNYLLPVNNLLEKKINESANELKLFLQISGTALELIQEYRRDGILSIKALLETGCVQMLSLPYYNSASYFYSVDEFSEQLTEYNNFVKNIFNIDTVAFGGILPIISFLHYHLVKDTDSSSHLEIMADYRHFAKESDLFMLAKNIDWQAENHEFSDIPASSPPYETEKIASIANSSLLKDIYQLEDLAKNAEDPMLLKWWRRLQDVSYYGFDTAIDKTDDTFLKSIIANIEITLIRRHLAKRKNQGSESPFLL